MRLELYSVHYPDRDAAKLIYREISKLGDSFGIQTQALESYTTSSRRAKGRLQIILAILFSEGQNLPTVLKCLKEGLSSHPLYSYLSFDNVIRPLSQVKWDCGSYDEPSYQRIFIKKREIG